MISNVTKARDVTIHKYKVFLLYLHKRHQSKYLEKIIFQDADGYYFEYVGKSFDFEGMPYLSFERNMQYLVDKKELWYERSFEGKADWQVQAVKDSFISRYRVLEGDDKKGEKKYVLIRKIRKEEVENVDLKGYYDYYSLVEIPFEIHNVVDVTKKFRELYEQRMIQSPTINKYKPAPKSYSRKTSVEQIKYFPPKWVKPTENSKYSQYGFCKEKGKLVWNYTGQTIEEWEDCWNGRDMILFYVKDNQPDKYFIVYKEAGNPYIKESSIKQFDKNQNLIIFSEYYTSKEIQKEFDKVRLMAYAQFIQDKNPSKKTMLNVYKDYPSLLAQNRATRLSALQKALNV